MAIEMSVWSRGLALLLLATTALAQDPLSPAELARAIRWAPHGESADAAARLLGRGGEKGWERLAGVILQLEPDAAQRLVRHLADGRAPARLERIAKTVRVAKDPQVRAVLVIGLAKGYPASASVVMEHLKKGGARGTDVVRALDVAGAPTQVLIDCLEFPAVALEAYALLRKRGGEAIGDEIAAAGRKAALLGFDPHACEALARRAPDFDLLAAVAELLADQQRDVRVGAHALLMHVSGKKLAPDTLLWQSWIAARRDTFKRAPEPTEGAIAAAVLRGREFLRTALLRDGRCRWTRESAENGTIGATALAVLALRAAGTARDDAAIQRALRETMLVFGKRDLPGLPAIPKKFETYNASLLAMALTQVDPVRFRPVLETLRKRLVHGQLPDGRWNYKSGYATDKPPSGQGDNSNTQYAILGLRALHRAGLEVPAAVWNKNAEYWRKKINAHKGWPYHTTKDWRSIRRISMTSAGVASLAICIEGVAGAKARDLIDGDATMRAGLEGLGRQLFVRGFTKEALYALYSVERACVLGSTRDFTLGKQRFDWYEQGALKLLAMQARAGSWGSRQATPGVDGTGWGPHVDTAYAILFLTRATASIGRGQVKSVAVTLGAKEKLLVLLRPVAGKTNKPPLKQVAPPLLVLESTRLTSAGERVRLVGRVAGGATLQVEGRAVAADLDGWFTIVLDATRPRAIVVEARHGERTQRITAHVERDTTAPTVRIRGKSVFGPGLQAVTIESDEELSHLVVGRRTVVARGRSVVAWVKLKEGSRMLGVEAYDRAGNRSRQRLPIEVANRVLALDGASALGIAMHPLPQVMTVECWVRAEAGQTHASVLANTEGSGFAIYWRHRGRAKTPSGWSFVLGTGYVSTRVAKSPPARRWAHLAMTIDEERIRIFVDGKPSGETAGGPRLLSRYHVMVGAEPISRHRPSMIFKGAVDGVRISRGVRYEQRFRPERHPQADKQTLLLLNFDGPKPFADESGAHRKVFVHGKPQALVEKR